MTGAGAKGNFPDEYGMVAYCLLTQTLQNILDKFEALELDQ